MSKSANWIAAELAAAEKQSLLAPPKRHKWSLPLIATFIALIAWEPLWIARGLFLLALIVGLYWIVEEAHNARREK